jgi:prepilin-type N-terminal cleavage/methylation domain-containing protein
MRGREDGFTLLEVMVVVALIAVLVAIAIPMYGQTSKKAKGGAEVPAVFNDMRIRMDQFHQENGTYPDSAAGPGEGTFHPAAPTLTKQAILPLPASWAQLRVRITGPGQVYCGYTWVTNRVGVANNGPVGAIAAAAPFNFVAPASNWYYLLARCNFDGNAGTDSYYFSSSVDPTIRKLNEGM